MQKIIFRLSVTILFFGFACNTKNSKRGSTEFLKAGDVVLLNQLIYKAPIEDSFKKYAPGYEVVYLPHSINSNFAIIAKKMGSNQYALVIRGSVIEFSNEGFENFFLQDFNIFNMKAWNYTDTAKDAYISNGAWTGFQNLLQLKDISSGLSLKDFIEQKINPKASLVITGHSLGGNLAYPLAGYLKKELKSEIKNNMNLITFGAPAAGNAAFILDMEEKFPNGERYAATNDIAPVFPDINEIEKVAALIGLDSVLQINKLNLGGLEKAINIKDILNIAGDILDKTNIISPSSKYAQSQKHLRVLNNADTINHKTSLSVETVFDKAYRFHKIDTYARLLDGTGIN